MNMPVGVKRKDKLTLTPVLPPSVDLNKKPRGSSVLKRIREQAKAEEQQIQEAQKEAAQESQPEVGDTGSPKLSTGANFMDDLLWVYTKLGGKGELLRRARKDPQVRNQVFQTLLRMEFKKQEGQIRKEAKGGGRERKGMLLIFKGLEDAENGLKVGDGKVGRREMAHILEPGSDLNEDGVQEKMTYQYAVQEMTDDEEKKVDAEGQDQGLKGSGEGEEGDEEVVMDDVLEEE